VYVLSEDQLPKMKNELTLEKDFEKILSNYEYYRDRITKPGATTFDSISSKKYIWGYPKKNPNLAKKYYSKKDKK